VIGKYVTCTQKLTSDQLSVESLTCNQKSNRSDQVLLLALRAVQ